jgi:hypothetical protein
MINFANRAAFDDPKSRMLALGIDVSAARAIVDHRGAILAYARTGGMINPERWELRPGSTIYRFGGTGRSAQDVAKGGWWVERREFEQLVSFANTHGLFIGMAMRLLCLVPPEWSDASLLVRARVSRGLLAWRGLANTVVTPMKDGVGTVRLPHQNEIAARRLHQLFVPGLGSLNPLEPAISVEHAFHLDPSESARGFLYL